jgi:hypothetical protein
MSTMELKLPTIQFKKFSRVGVYTIVDDYVLLDAPRETLIVLRHELVHEILSKVDYRSLLLSLKTLAISVDSPTKSQFLARDFLKRLPSPSQIRLNRLLQEGDRIFLCRQQVLAAIRQVIVSGGSFDVNEMKPLDAAIILSHAVLDAEDDLANVNDEFFGGLPARLAIYLAANQDFNTRVDVIARFDRAIRLWRDYGPRFSSRLGGKEPHEILKNHFKLDIEDILAVAFGVWSYDLSWDPVNPRPLARSIHPRASPALVTSFMRVMAADVDTFSRELLVQRSDWDFLPFEKRPIIELESGWLLIDAGFLMDRVTIGLYYFVFDDLKAINESLAL